MASTPAPSLSCNDSGLSTTASIVGILTFALGLLASYIALQSATRGAPSEIARLVTDLRTTQKEINRVAAYVFDNAHGAVSRGFESAPTRYKSDSGRRPAAEIKRQAVVVEVGMGHMQALYDEVQDLLGNCVRLFIEADDLLKRCESDVARWDPEGLRRRIIFVMNRHEVAEKMSRLEEQKVRLGDVRMALFLRKSATQDGVLREIREEIRELQMRRGRGEGENNDSGVHVRAPP